MLADSLKYLAAVIALYNLIEYGDNVSKILGVLWQYFGDESADNIAYSNSFKFKARFFNKIDNNFLWLKK